MLNFNIFYFFQIFNYFERNSAWVIKTVVNFQFQIPEQKFNRTERVRKFFFFKENGAAIVGECGARRPADDERTGSGERENNGRKKIGVDNRAEKLFEIIQVLPRQLRFEKVR